MSETYQDKDIACKDCAQVFVWTAGEQQWFAERQMRPPKRCKPCRAMKRAVYEANVNAWDDWR